MSIFLSLFKFSNLLVYVYNFVKILITLIYELENGLKEIKTLFFIFSFYPKMVISFDDFIRKWDSLRVKVR